MCLITCQSHTNIHERIQWKPCNPKSHYTQICKVSHGYIERVHTTKITKWNPYMAQITYKQRYAKWDLESKKHHATTNNYISNKIVAYTRILFINSTLCCLF